ncbi:UNVERIFIED_CONTAM: hypothetical protein ITH24_24730, partial [Salmonella enterica subsp. enterica serovar Weltevreden]
RVAAGSAVIVHGGSTCRRAGTVARVRIGGRLRAVIVAGMRVRRRGRRAAVIVRVAAGLTTDRVVGFTPVTDSARATGAVGIEHRA